MMLSWLSRSSDGGGDINFSEEIRMSTDLCYLELTELTSRIRTRQVSAVEATQAALDRIEKPDKKLFSFALVTPELALEQARHADAEIKRGE